jgi:hypothetical protein
MDRGQSLAAYEVCRASGWILVKSLERHEDVMECYEATGMKVWGDAARVPDKLENAERRSVATER